MGYNRVCLSVASSVMMICDETGMKYRPKWGQTVSWLNLSLSYLSDPKAAAAAVRLEVVFLQVLTFLALVLLENWCRIQSQATHWFKWVTKLFWKYWCQTNVFIKPLSHKQGCDRVLCWEQRIINTGKRRRQNKIDRTRRKQAEEEMTGCCWQFLLTVRLCELSVFILLPILSQIRCIAYNQSGKSNTSQQPINASTFWLVWLCTLPLWKISKPACGGAFIAWN